MEQVVKGIAIAMMDDSYALTLLHLPAAGAAEAASKTGTIVN
jgi:hypothetical protein